MGDALTRLAKVLRPSEHRYFINLPALYSVMMPFWMAVVTAPVRSLTSSF